MPSSFCCFACIDEDEVGIVERFGKFVRLAKPGLQPIMCCLGECMSGSVNTRMRQLDVRCETKTKDDVFVDVTVSVQYVALKTDEDYFNAYYKLTNTTEQIKAYVFDVVRSAVPAILLDDVFASKAEIADAVKAELSQTMPSFGYLIHKTLVTDIDPDQRIKDALNEIQIANRERIAATDKALADKIRVVTAAEADAESKYQQGLGISRQRQAIISGLQDSVENFNSKIDEVGPKEILQLMLMTQYFDTLSSVAASSKTNTIFVPAGPGAVSTIGEEIRQGMLQAQAATGQEMSRT